MFENFDYGPAESVRILILAGIDIDLLFVRQSVKGTVEYFVH